MPDTSFLKLALEKNAKPFSAVAGVGGFISDVLEPIAPFCQYIFYIGGTLAVFGLIIYAIASILRGQLAPAILFLTFASGFSGLMYSIQNPEQDTGFLAESIPAIASLQKSLGIIQKDITLIKDNTTQANIKLDAISKQISELKTTGVAIENPSTSVELYHNAMLYAQHGEYGKASNSWDKYFNLENHKDALDAHLAYQNLLKVREGRIGANRIYRAKFSGNESIVIRYAKCLLLADKPRLSCLKELQKTDSNFAPSYYEHSYYWSDAERGQQSLADKKKELALLQSFKHAAAQGGLHRWYKDQNIPEQHLKDARLRLKKLEPILKNIQVEPITLDIAVSNSNWIITAFPSESAIAIRWKLEHHAEYTLTEFLPISHPETQRPMPQPSFYIPLATKPTNILVQYQDINEQWQGPYTLKFEPLSAIQKHSKKLLKINANSWFEAEHYSGNTTLHYGIVAAFRCAVKQAQWGIDTPNKTLPVDSCNTQKPFYVDRADIPLPADTKSLKARLQFYDGEWSEIMEIIVTTRSD